MKIKLFIIFLLGAHGVYAMEHRISDDGLRAVMEFPEIIRDRIKEFLWEMIAAELIDYGNKEVYQKLLSIEPDEPLRKHVMRATGRGGFIHKELVIEDYRGYELYISKHTKKREFIARMLFRAGERLFFMMEDEERHFFSLYVKPVEIPAGTIDPEGYEEGPIIGEVQFGEISEKCVVEKLLPLAHRFTLHNLLTVISRQKITPEEYARNPDPKGYLLPWYDEMSDATKALFKKGDAFTDRLFLFFRMMKMGEHVEDAE